MKEKRIGNRKLRMTILELQKLNRDNFPKDRFTSERIQKSINKLMLGAPESKDHDSSKRSH